MFVDSHAHLDMPEFEADLEAVLNRARAAGVALIVTIGTGNPYEGSVERTLALAGRSDWLRAGIGVHPHDSRLADEAYWVKMSEWAAHPEVVLWGEIGLDYYYDHSRRDIQRSVFRRQLDMARERRLPVSIHCREAWADLLPILEEAARGDAPRGILHSFSGTLDQARACVDLGFLISFSGIVTFKNAEPLRQVVAGLGLEALVVETDSPYLAPVPHRGKRNEPAFVVDVARAVAAVLEVDLEEVARRTTRNIRDLLRLDPQNL